MVREAEENDIGNEVIIKSRGRGVINPETLLRSRQISGDQRVVDVTVQLLHRL